MITWVMLQKAKTKGKQIKGSIDYSTNFHSDEFSYYCRGMLLESPRNVVMTVFLKSKSTQQPRKRKQIITQQKVI